MYYNAISLWWETIAGPLQLVEQVANCLNEGVSVILQDSNLLPWPDDFRHYVAQKVDAYRVETIDWDAPAERSFVVPGLLRRLSPSHAHMCPSDEKNRISFLKTNSILSNTLTWLVCPEDKNPSAVISFISDYRGKRLSDHGVFVVEVPGHVSLPQLSDSVQILDCANFITKADMRLFTSIMADSNRDLPVELREYAARLVAAFLCTDATQVESLLSHIDFANGEPIAAVRDLLGDNIPAGCDDEILHNIVWTAQLQSAFSGLEIIRVELIAEYESALRQALDTEHWNPKRAANGYILDFNGERIEDPYNLEFGKIAYMKGLRQTDDHDAPLVLVSDSEWWYLIHFFHECRNKLAHHQLCDPEKFHQLLTLISG